MLPEKIAFVDLETTGARAQFDQIIEIGILRVENNTVTKTYSTLINPLSYLPPMIESLTGITAEALETAPTFREVADDIMDILTDCVFVAHNVRFDYSFLKHSFKRINLDYSAKHFCTVKLSRSLFPRFRRHNLDSIIERFGFPCERRHRAFDDAKVLYDFYQHIQTKFTQDVISKAVSNGLRRPSLPLKLSLTDLEQLPDSPGVYIFYGADTTNTAEIALANSKVREKTDDITGLKLHKGLIPLYIGKSKNIRTRVLSHFSGDVHSSLEMKISQQIEHIETIETAGELGALFLESELIKQHLPLYNKQLRIKKKLLALRSSTNEQGYLTVRMEPLLLDEIAKLSLTTEELESFLGFFQSAKQTKTFLANLAKEHNLCEKYLGLEKNKRCLLCCKA